MIGRTVGPYELGALLGQGGMGAVYRCRHVALGVERAIKLLPPGAAEAQLRRFEREAQNLARVEHPAVVRVHEAGVSDGQPYLVMELVAGEGLDRLLERGRVPLARALSLAAALARGVAALHAAGVVHRDLKPGNVLVREDGQLVIVDLGLAVAPDRDERLTRTGALLGTPLYMAPEQLEGRVAGAPADVRAAGLVAFELATGRPAVPPLAGLLALMDEVVRRDRPAPSSVDPELPAALDRLLARALDRRPDHRPDAATLASELEALAASVAGGSTTSARAARRRSLGLALVAAAALAVPSAGLALGWSEAGALATRDRTDSAPRPAQPPRVAPAPPSPVAPAPPNAAAARQLRRLEREPGPAARAAAAREWLARWPDDPERPAAEAVLRRAQAFVPTLLATPPATQFGRFLDASRIVTCSQAGLHLWDAATGAPLGLLTDVPASGPLVVVPGGPALAVDGPRVQPVHPDGRAGPVLVRPARVTCLAVSRDGRVLVTGHDDGVARASTFPDGRALADLPGHGHGVCSVAVSRDGRYAATGTGIPVNDPAESDNSMRLWDLSAGGGLLRREVVNARVLALVFVLRADGVEELLVGTTGGHLYRFALDRAGPVVELMGSGARDLDVGGAILPRAQTGGIHAVAVSQDGQRAWSVSAGSPSTHNELRTWDLVSGAERYAVLAHERPMHTADLSPDGARLVTSGVLGIELWTTD